MPLRPIRLFRSVMLASLLVASLGAVAATVTGPTISNPIGGARPSW
jgi:hypothetical protein